MVGPPEAPPSADAVRAAFDAWFPPERIGHVDVPGLDMTVLSQFGFKRCPRPIFPLDPDMTWTPG
ncbi:MAG: hypothetical protein EXQ95_13880 [Alphaproteobacteria bacterium]|nr:hypothetical protein [Alphaproteobacteria bacterium]